MNWIKVEDELPPLKEKVLVFIPKHTDSYGLQWSDAVDFAFLTDTPNKEVKWVYWSPDIEIKAPVTHWCEIPYPNE